MKYRVLAVTGVLALLGAAVFAILGATNDDDPTASGGGSEPNIVQVAASPAPEQVAGPISAEPPAAAEELPLVLTAPSEARPDASVTFGASWITPAGDPVSGKVDLQRIEGNAWTTVTTIPVENGQGQVDVQVRSSGIYRLAYGGGPEVEAIASHEVVVTAGAQLASRLTATAEVTDDGAVGVTAAWTTDGGVPIVGDIGLEQQADGEEWAPLSAVTTTAEGTAVVDATAEHTTRFRFSYAGGSRFAAVTSEEALALGDDVRTIPVELCDDDVDIDNLGNGVGCHYTPVESGTFVVAHDYLGNSWWNSIPEGTFVQLEGEFAGLYEVVNRVIAQGRGSALGSASNWTCGDECDIVLQTCQGSNTGFTWIRRVEDEAPQT
ncbi:hypothetical protein [Jiangella anatolica]|uniref:Uncharacterized protein n=1 Tax=Jiangella anatolica TaxID=2670374 RepID=A0A2W2BBN2_9ACTN|nr:hypothetical protein [Jiangella anatolica]PZF85021.1 hypothetical protein C1I92_06950 [Jiangella anatolica]